MMELRLQIAQGDEIAFSRFFHLYKDKVYTVAFRLTESPFLAEEIVQDVFLKIWIKRETLPEVLSLEDYLFITTRNHVFNTLKRLARRRQLEESWSSELTCSENSTDSMLLTEETAQVLQQAVELLPPQQKQVYLLSKEQELKREEIALLLDISAETVKTHLSRAMKYVRAYSMSRLGIKISSLLFFLFD